MPTFLLYSLKAAGCLAVFYLFYKLLLSRDTLHRMNRVLLCGVLLLSFLLPLCVITVEKELPGVSTAGIDVIPESYFRRDMVFENRIPDDTRDLMIIEEPEPAPEPFDWGFLLGIIYFAGMFATLGWTVCNIVRVVRMTRRGRRIPLGNGSVLVLSNRIRAPFSWMKYVVMSEEDYACGGGTILVHEQAHQRLGHSWDLLLVDLLGCLQWFNPAMWLLRVELRAVHEYEADEQVLRCGVDAKDYQMLLIKKAVGGRWYSIANSFNHSKLKNRITMMLRKKSSRWTGARVLLLLPLTALALGAFAETVYLFPEDKGKKENPKIHASAPDGADPLVLVDGREQPASSINDITSERIQSITVLKDSTAIRMYGDKGRNGVVLVELKKEGDGTPQSDADDVTVVGYASSDDAPIHVVGKEGALPEHVLYLVDGERVPEIGSLDPGRIESVSVLKGKDNIPSEYAGQGYEGVIEIRTKKKSDGVRVLSPEEARAYFESKEGKEVQRSLDRMEAYFKSDEWKEALRKMEASGEYFNSDEWKEAQRKMDAYFKSDEWKEAQRKMEASSEYFKSDEWQEALRKMEASGEYFNSDEWKEAQLRLKELDKLSDRLGSEDGLGIVIRNASIGKGAFAGMKVYIDGREASSEEVDRLDPEKIRHMEVLTGKKAVRRYGEQASEGVVEIKTRK